MYTIFEVLFMELNILYENADFIVVVKPQGVPVTKDKTGDFCLTDFLKSKNLFVINRLDRPVGGLVLFAKNEHSAKNLSAQMQNNEISKKYLAVSNGLAKNSDILENYLVFNNNKNFTHVVNSNLPTSKYARLYYDLLACGITKDRIELSLLDITLITGRHHQIRTQLNHCGLPIWGDKKYNIKFANNRNQTNIALWSYYLGFKNPKTKIYLEFFDLPTTLFPFSIFPINNFNINCISTCNVL